MTASAQHSHPAVHRVCSDETGTAAEARLAGTAIRREPLDEGAAASAGIAIIAKAGAARRDGFGEHVDDGVAKSSSLGGRHASGGSRRIYPRAPQRLVRVDVADSRYVPLIHEELLYGLPRGPKKDR